jgi:signal transduction histidine kinase
MTHTRPNRTAVAALYLVGLAVIARMAVGNANRGLLPWYLALDAMFMILHVAVWRLNGLRPWILHVAFACQSAIVVALLALNPHLDFVPTLFVLLSYQAAVVFAGRLRWLWPLLFVLLTAVPLMAFLGPLRGLALALMTMAGEIVLPAFAAASDDIERAHGESEAAIQGLEATQGQLRASIERVEGLAALEERNRIARELHDSVSRTISSIMSTTRSAQELQGEDPARLSGRLVALQGLTRDALAQMRALIDELRPQPEGPVESEPSASD